MRNCFSSLMLCVTLLFTSCDSTDKNSELILPELPVPELQITPEVVADFERLGFNVNNLEVVTFGGPCPDGITTPQQYYQLQGDMLFTAEDLEKRVESHKNEELDDAQSSRESIHYYAVTEGGTPMIVNAVTRIKVLAWYDQNHPDSPYNLTNEDYAALYTALEHYNNLNMGLTFVLYYGSNTQGSHTVVFSDRESKSSIASGRVPVQDDRGYFWPGSRIRIGAQFNSLNSHNKARALAHEIGHTIGLHHTDQFTANCGVYPVAAVPASETENYTDPNSVMYPCTSRSSWLQYPNMFTPTDRRVLETTYPVRFGY
jgi:hypothetical protein